MAGKNIYTVERPSLLLPLLKSRIEQDLVKDSSVSTFLKWTTCFYTGVVTTLKLVEFNLMDDLRFRKIFNLGIRKDISEKKLSKLEKLQSLVAKCCKIRKI